MPLPTWPRSEFPEERHSDFRKRNRERMDLHVQLEELINATRVVELQATSRSDAINELVKAVDWSAEGVLPDDVARAVEEREATAHTIVDKGLALPHALIDWSGDFRVVLGRSVAGIDYLGTGDTLHLILLLVVGRSGLPMHLEVLAAVAKLLNDGEFREAVVNAANVREIKKLLVERASQQQRKRPSPAKIPPRSVAVVQHAVGLAESLSAQAILLALDDGQAVPWRPLATWPGRLLMITAKRPAEATPKRPDTHFFEISHASLSRMDRANLGLLLAAANGLVDQANEVVCITGLRGHALDSISVTRPAAHFSAVFPDKDKQASNSVPPAVILRILSLAIELGSEGREAHPIGAMFVIGDARQVMRQTQQLVLNPFHGFSRRLRNVLDPSLAETVKEYALLDGAFIVETDGVIKSAGTYLIPKSHVTDLPGGLGARHQAAAAITAETRAIAITVSQSTGTVTLFQRGLAALTLERATMTRW